MALEHTILLHWVIERGDIGVKAILAAQAKNVSKSIEIARRAKVLLRPEVERELQATAQFIDEREIVGQFRHVCGQIGVLELYWVYGVRSQFIHPSVYTINTYCDSSGNLAINPQRGIYQGNLALLAYCLIWANRDLDTLTPGHPKAEELERLARSVEAAPVLPAYRPVPPASVKRSRRNKKRRR